MLPPGDVTYLDSHHKGWETILAGAARWLLLSKIPVPEGYDQSSVTAALRIEAAYPDTQVDMVYFSPGLRRTDGVAIPATESNETIDGRVFQRWSRHRSAENPWLVGEDGIETHMLLVNHWLEREFARCAK